MKSIVCVLFLSVLVTVSLTGCMSAQQHQSAVQADERKLTAGTVQKEIRSGMSQPEVAAALGSPNIVTRDSEGRETWIYDKISTETVYSSSSGGVDALVLGFGSTGGGLGGTGYSQSAGASRLAQRTLTVIIKYAEGKVDEFSYHATSF